MAVPQTEAPAYTDIAGLSKLKRAAGNNDPAAIRTVAQQFESMFTRMMLKSMRDAVGPDPMFGSDQEQMYQGMADDQLAIQLSRGKGLGLADMLIRQLQRLGVKGADAAATGAAASNPGTPAATASKAAAAYSATQRSSATTSSTASSTTGTPTDAARTSFIRDLWPQAQQAGLLLGVDPRNLIAQAALETHWGEKMPQDSAGRSSNNLFGMKASADWSGVTATGTTQEFQGGIAAGTSAQFKAYPTAEQSFADYAALLRNNPRYSGALNTGADVQTFATALQRGGYATDPDYANKIVALAGTVAHELGDSVPSSAAGQGLKLAGSLPLTPDAAALQRP